MYRVHEVCYGCEHFFKAGYPKGERCVLFCQKVCLVPMVIKASGLAQTCMVCHKDLPYDDLPECCDKKVEQVVAQPPPYYPRPPYRRACLGCPHCKIGKGWNAEKRRDRRIHVCELANHEPQGYTRPHGITTVIVSPDFDVPFACPYVDAHVVAKWGQDAPKTQ
jgi:hypothetical protein